MSHVFLISEDTAKKHYKLVLELDLQGTIILAVIVPIKIGPSILELV